MGLDFTTIKDQPGSAIYFIHDGSEQGRMRFEKLMADVASRTKKQTVLMSEDEDNGSEIVKFYQLRGLGGFVLIVRDDDQLHQSWNGRDRLDPATIAYVAERAG